MSVACRLCGGPAPRGAPYRLCGNCHWRSTRGRTGKDDWIGFGPVGQRGRSR